ncbi:MAG: LptF/LptG family permease [Paludibacteraceae bacterium]|nr:LptF/LptG family permease [Paludibacteraceae bacterium]
MKPIKILHWYILRNFLKTFSITFFVSLFVLVMQFMFHYADDLIGKGAGVWPITKLFFYSTMSLIPLSLPLSILLGSLMTFGNLGERLELLSMKAAGISLSRILAPLIIVIGLMSIGSFFFADKVLPKAQVQMWTLIFSIREKSPELNIPEGSFYSDINGINLYAGNKKSGFLYDVVIYDLSKGFDNTAIILADTAKIEMSNDKTYLLLTLFNGESFENMSQGSKPGISNDEGIIPYRRESFKRKKLAIDFDANFTEISSSFLDGQYVSKNINELQYTIDSMTHKVDSITDAQITKQQTTVYFEHNGINSVIKESENRDSHYAKSKIRDIYMKLDSVNKIQVLDNAISRCHTISNDIEYDKAITDWMFQEIRVHAIEWHKKLTLAFACFIFLFIGAPLGAIIRKGGMGMPIVVSTVLFIVYYIIDNAGYKMAREGMWEVWCGMWLSAFVLLPLGVTLTYLAATDNTVMNGEAFKMFFNKIKNKYKKNETKHN